MCLHHRLIKSKKTVSSWQRKEADGTQQKPITDVDYADDIAILANESAQAEKLLHRLEQAAGGIGFHVNAHKTEYILLYQIGDISTQGSSSLKLVDKFTFLGSSMSSTEKDIYTRLAKAWTATELLLCLYRWSSNYSSNMQKQKLHHFCNRSSPDDGPKSGRKY